MPCEGKETRKAIEILHTIAPKIPIDLLVRTPERLEQRLAWNDFFLQEIMQKGQLLYESPSPVKPLWETLRPHLQALTAFGVDFRYPGESADKEEAREALKYCATVRKQVRSSLGSKP